MKVKKTITDIGSINLKSRIMSLSYYYNGSLNMLHFDNINVRIDNVSIDTEKNELLVFENLASNITFNIPLKINCEYKLIENFQKRFGKSTEKIVIDMIRKCLQYAKVDCIEDDFVYMNKLTKSIKDSSLSYSDKTMTVTLIGNEVTSGTPYMVIDVDEKNLFLDDDRVVSEQLKFDFY